MLLTVAVLARYSTGAVPADFDCATRKLAMEFAQQIQPQISRSQLAAIADALNGSGLVTENNTLATWPVLLLISKPSFSAS